MTLKAGRARTWINRRTAVASLIAAVAVVITTFVVSDRRAPAPAPQRPACLAGGERPCSTNVQMGKAYRFQVLHCGLTWVVDFDQSFWDVDATTMTEDENGRFGINSDEGTMTLEKDDVAVYRSVQGGAATLHRHKGAKTFSVCG